MKILRFFRMAKLLKIDTKKGYILVNGIRVLILPVDVSSALNKGLTKVVGKSVVATLYPSGKEIGNSIFDLFVKIYGYDAIKSEDEYKKAVEDFVSLGGFGRMEITDIDLKKGSCVLRGWGFPEVISITDSEEPVCHLMRGICSRFMELVTSKPFDGVEVKCQAKGDEYCEIRMNTE